MAKMTTRDHELDEAFARLEDTRSLPEKGHGWPRIVGEFNEVMLATVPKAVSMYGRGRVLRAVATVSAQQYPEPLQGAAVLRYFERVTDLSRPWKARRPWLVPYCMVEEGWLICQMLAMELVFAPRVEARRLAAA